MCRGNGKALLSVAEIEKQRWAYCEVRKVLQSDSNRDAAGLCNGLKIYSSARILQMPLLCAVRLIN